MPDDMTGFEYVLLGRSPYVSYFGHESRTTGRWSTTCSIASTSSSSPIASSARLSGGERQRLVIARALAQEAPVLLLDEPTSALDIGHQQQALELVDRLRREHGLTVVSAMHDLTLAGLYADRLALLHEGHLVAVGQTPRMCCAPRRSASSTGVGHGAPTRRRHRRRHPPPQPA